MKVKFWEFFVPIMLAFSAGIFSAESAKAIGFIMVFVACMTQIFILDIRDPNGAVNLWRRSNRKNDGKT